MDSIQAGQVYEVGERRSVRWRILSVDGDTAHATRVRKADGSTWVWDVDAGRDFPLATIVEHWRLLA